MSFGSHGAFEACQDLRWSRAARRKSLNCIRSIWESNFKCSIAERPFGSGHGALRCRRHPDVSDVIKKHWPEFQVFATRDVCWDPCWDCEETQRIIYNPQDWSRMEQKQRDISIRFLCHVSCIHFPYRVPMHRTTCSLPWSLMTIW